MENLPIFLVLSKIGAKITHFPMQKKKINKYKPFALCKVNENGAKIFLIVSMQLANFYYTKQNNQLVTKTCHIIERNVCTKVYIVWCTMMYYICEIDTKFSILHFVYIIMQTQT